LNAVELRTHLRNLGVELVVDGGRLRVSAARGLITPELQTAIADHRTELLELLGREVSPPVAPLVAIDRRTELPLSYFQERLWIVHRLDPLSTAYNMAVRWLFQPSDGGAHLAKAVNKLIEQHEILRSVFVERDLGPVVKILPAVGTSVDVIQLDDNVDRDETDARLERDVNAAVHRPFDLADEPPVRFKVYQHISGYGVLIVAAHHIAFDAWSLTLLKRYLDAGCKTLGAPGPAKATVSGQPTFQYVDYAAWQRRTQASRGIEANLAWWRKQLSNVPPLCLFPPDRSPTEISDAVAFHRFSWNAEFASRVRSLVQAEGATVYMALLAAFGAVLHSHTGFREVALGNPMDAREQPAFETMIGPFINVLVLRLGLDGDMTFRDLLGSVRNALLDSYDRHVPFELLIEHLKPKRTRNHQPLFQMAVVQHSGINETGYRIYAGGATHDITWYVNEVGGCLDHTIEYRPDLYDGRTIEHIAGHIECFLKGAVADPKKKLDEIPLMVPQERSRLISDFNATAVEIETATFAEQFEHQVTSVPKACAITWQGAVLSYADVNRRANQLARRLLALGIGSGSLVGVLIDRRPELLIALIGVQKAGAAYVPLDPAFPSERLAFMLHDCGAKLLVTFGDAAADLQAPTGMRTLNLSEDAALLEQLDGTNPGTKVQSSDLAYVIYTSGSLGHPKGVAVSHGALSNFLGAMRREPGLAPDDILAAITTVSFDIAALELYLPLTVGARIALLSREALADGVVLADQLASTDANVMQATPATWRLLVETGWKGRPGFRALCGGEALSEDLADRLHASVSELWNLYGPTETTIWSTLEKIERPGRVSVGKPIANTRIYVLGRNGEPTPIGLPGEIWIGGAGVADGYYRRDDLTNERFVPDSFANDPGARVYRTGDLGRWGEDGRLYHLGRLDLQVKIRGVRMELEEIETVLRSHPQIRNAVVTVSANRHDGQDARLAAHIVYGEGASLTTTDIRRYLKRRLPDAMVPSVFVTLDVVPLTPNGKVDRNALSNPFQSTIRHAIYQKPAPGSEAKIAEIWQRFLKLDRVSAEDNFFDLGGHSLLTLQVANVIERETGWRMDPRALFFQNLRQIAAGLKREKAEVAETAGLRRSGW